MGKLRKEGGEDLEGMLRGLKLTEQECKGVKGAWRSEVLEVGTIPQAVGKLFSTKSGYAEGLSQTLGKIWCPQKGVRCKELGNNLFLFSFLQPGGKRRAIMEGPWDFGGDLMILVEFDDSKRLKDLEFTYTPVWIRVFDLPLGLMTGETGRRIGNSVGKILEVDKDEDDMAVGEYLRIKVLIDIRKPLCRGITLEHVEGAGEFWCNFKYEFLPNFCYSCGLLGHVEKECDEGGWRDESRQFGEWLRVNPGRRKEGRGRWSEGGSAGGSFFQRKETSGGKGASQRWTGSTEAARKSTEQDDELKDDCESPLKTHRHVGCEGVPRKLGFGEDLKGEGSLVRSVAKKAADENNKRGCSHPTEQIGTRAVMVLSGARGEMGYTGAVGEEGGNNLQTNVKKASGKVHMAADGGEDDNKGKQIESETEHHAKLVGSEQGGKVKGKGVAGEGVGGKKATFRRRPRVVAEESMEEKLNLAKKRAATDEEGRDMEIRKKQRSEADGMDGEGIQMLDESAGWLSHARLDK